MKIQFNDKIQIPFNYKVVFTNPESKLILIIMLYDARQSLRHSYRIYDVLVFLFSLLLPVFYPCNFS